MAATAPGPGLVSLRPALDAVSELGATERPSALRAYYAIKPLLPRRLQIAARRRLARRRVTWGVPAWPVEPLGVERLHSRLAAALAASGEDRVPFVGLWPDRCSFAVTLTHDVEGPAGVANVERVRSVERRYGLVSSWNFVARDYDTPPELLDRLRAEGCEIGVHGLTHDGSLFRSRADFERQLTAIRERMAEWGAVGFR